MPGDTVIAASIVVAEHAVKGRGGVQLHALSKRFQSGRHRFGCHLQSGISVGAVRLTVPALQARNGNFTAAEAESVLLPGHFAQKRLKDGLGVR